MGKQFLIPVRDENDAESALSKIGNFAKAGDELVVLVISEIPEGELTGSRPPTQVIDPLATTGGVTSEPRAAHDRPVFMGREEVMQIRGQELHEALDPRIAALHDKGYQARVDAVFSDEPGLTIRDYAGDLNVTDVYVTEAFRSELDDETQEVVKTL